jgi:lipoate-protein ligase A
MALTLHVLPERSGSAAENMATDFLLLQRYPAPQHVRFRHYPWRNPAFTFGYSQKIAFVREQLPPGERFDLCRRPTGGGIVDHREDWTYALVIPRGHPLEELRASASYRAVHEAIAAALRAQNEPAELQGCEPCDDEGPTPAGVCFQRAEAFDVVHADTRRKIAGAAQKRNKHGLLFQGSIWRPAVSAGVDWDRFSGDFVAQLAQTLAVEATEVSWPDFNEEELSALSEQYSAPDWIEFR